MALLLPLHEKDTFPVIRKLLRRNRIVIMPCDTIYGIVGAAPDTEERIRLIKGRGEEKPFIQLLPAIEYLSRLSPAPLPDALRPFWPGPLTLVMPASGQGTVAVRVPADPLLRRLLAAVGKSLYSTSVNYSGRPSLWKIRDILEAFADKVEAVVDGGDLPEGAPSTLVDITVRPYRLLRAGSLRLPEELFR